MRTNNQKGSTALIIVLVVLVVIAAAFIYVSGFGPLSQNRTTPVISNTAPITIDQLTNATIPDFIGVTPDSSMITFAQGTVQYPASAKLTYEVDLDQASTSYAYGDLNADGVSDMAVVLNMTSGGTGVFSYLTVFTNNNGAPKFVDGQVLGDRIKVNQISINNGIISSDIITQGPGEPMCCGTLRTVVQYKLSAGKLQQVLPGSNNSNNATGNSEPTPHIDSIAPSSAAIGSKINVNGSNLNGFEGDLDVWVENSAGQKAIIHGLKPQSTASDIQFTLATNYCTIDTSYSGAACPEYMAMTRGTYTMYAMPWGTESNKMQFTVTSPQTTTWKTYTNSDLKLSFQYPSYLGTVNVTKTSTPGCPEMKTYQRTGVIDASDFQLNFSNKPIVNSGNSNMEYRIMVVTKPKNSADICGIDIARLEKDINYEYLASSPQAEKYTAFTQPHFDYAYVNSIGTSIGTFADQTYSLFKDKGSMVTLVQPIATFIPVYGSFEENAIQKLDPDGRNASAIATFISQDPYGEPIRSYFTDFRKLVDSITITN